MAVTRRIKAISWRAGKVQSDVRSSTLGYRLFNCFVDLSYSLALEKKKTIESMVYRFRRKEHLSPSPPADISIARGTIIPTSRIRGRIEDEDAGRVSGDCSGMGLLRRLEEAPHPR